MVASFIPNLKQVAAEAGVDASTVSLALRNDARIRLGTRQRIQELAHKMGYRRNPVVAQLMTQLRSGQQRQFQGTLALLDLAPHRSPATQVWEGIRARAETMGFGIDVFHTCDMTVARLEKVLLTRSIRGVVLTSVWGRRTLSEYRGLLSKFASCAVGLHVSEPDLNFVSTDHFLMTFSAMEKLHQAGFRRIGFAIHEGINEETEYRFIGGYLAARLKFADMKEIPIHINKPGDRSGFLAWVKRHKPEVIACVQEEMLSWLREAGYSIPRDLSIIHFEVDVLKEKWAGVRQNRFQRGSAAVDCVVSQINHNEKGAPASLQAIMIEGSWVPGPTLAH